MSATNRGAERRADDAYMTPPWCVDRLLEAWRPRGKFGILIEPAVGSGNIVRAIGTELFSWLTYDIREVDPPGESHFTMDFLKVVPRVSGEPRIRVPVWAELAEAVITNPPFSLAEEFLRHSRACFPGADLVFLLRLNFLAGEKKRLLWSDLGMPDVYVLPNRPDVSGGGGDSCEYAWFALPPERRPVGSLRVLATTPQEIRKAQKPRK